MAAAFSNVNITQNGDGTVDVTWTQTNASHFAVYIAAGYPGDVDIKFHYDGDVSNEIGADELMDETFEWASGETLTMEFISDVSVGSYIAYEIFFYALDEDGEPVLDDDDDDAEQEITVEAWNVAGICFLGDTKVETDQGKIRFDMLSTYNTINGLKIKQVVKVINSDDNLIFINKHAFGKKVPSKNTYIGRNHGVYLDDSFIQEKDLEPHVHELIYHIAGKNLVRARNLIKMGGVTEVKRGKKDTLYNVLLETHSTMIVNNIPCETLNPNDPMTHKFIK
uniref:Hedgehog/Intein (Hint) domain-containing protein n=1 Tax=viral metagenome TaxID=1070528 RepID=A0A6C0B485_9ZZZZ